MGVWGIGKVTSSLINTAGGAIGAHLDRNFARAQSEADRNFQREVYQNQYQWKAADAKKAGLHPLAVIGSGTYSASPSSQPSASSMASVLGKMGEGIGDVFTAYMNKDEVEAAKAASDQKFQKEMDLLDAQIGEIRARTVESVNRANSYTVPRATGREVVPGQTNAPVVDKLPGFKRTTGLVSDKNSAFHIWHMGDGAYDINFNPDYQGTVGDETGQLINALKAATRSDTWRDPDTGYVYYYDSDTGYYYRDPRPGHRLYTRSSAGGGNAGGGGGGV